MIEYPLAIDQTLTRVLEAGEGEEHVVFIHGLGARADRWRQTIGNIAAQGFRCYAFDLPGHGFARKGNGVDYTVPGLARFVGGLLDKLGIDQAHIVGTSLGGHIGAYLQCYSGTRVRSLTLVGTLGIVPIGPTVGRAIGDGIRLTSQEALRHKLRLVVADPMLVTDELVSEEYRFNNSPGAELSFAQLGDYVAERIDDDIVGPTLAKLAQQSPTLLVWGELDRVVPLTIGHAVRDILRDATFIVIPGAGHAPYLEQPAAFERALLAFWAHPQPEL